MIPSAKWLALRDRLAELWRNRNASTNQLVATLEMAQVAIEEAWGDTPGEISRCDYPGCNYRRHPASAGSRGGFCMYHVVGRDTFAARLRASIKRDKARAIDVSEFDGVLRLITENIAKH